jgi:preprotein translocase subunit YajC
MSQPSLFAALFAQATNVATEAGSTAGTPAASGPPAWSNMLYIGLIVAMVYFALIRPQQVAKKKADETIRGAKTGDKIVTTGGIHGVITNVKDATVILKIADNVKIEIEKSHIDKITRADTSAGSEKPAAAKA